MLAPSLRRESTDSLIFTRTLKVHAYFSILFSHMSVQYSSTVYIVTPYILYFNGVTHAIVVACRFAAWMLPRLHTFWHFHPYILQHFENCFYTLVVQVMCLVNVAFMSSKPCFV